MYTICHLQTSSRPRPSLLQRRLAAEIHQYNAGTFHLQKFLADVMSS
jgi:hypothetical protein